ncbi:lysophospholipid acyltransferase family protein [Spirosoma rhododendri]|uniref:Uncharacterized protein n=1 Tax=Spirosoma rhododendri TaxID=2728024 RepID=A0A7L5DJU3_9BACT|nr:hypothetical protein [Spirosoma rhododendri]QJD78724.1 hypothetical protein HH216_10000 [Spirosoma rhododendri]
MASALTLYREELAQCKSHFDQIDLRKERGYLMKFTTFSANVENIMPFIPRSQHETLFQQVLLQQVFTTFDLNCLSAGDLVDRRGSELISISAEPRIYCTYHLGSYRLLTSVLLRHGVDCVVLMGNNANRSQGDGICDHVESLRQERGMASGFRIVETGHPSAALTVLRELKAGKSIIVYVDGSPETAPEPGEESQFLTVDMGERQVLTRKGVGYLSHAAGVPIVPVVSYREDDMTNVLQSLTPIYPVKHSDREQYCQTAMQQLYDAFWLYLSRYPGQWEGWNYIQSFLKQQEEVHRPKRPIITHPTFNADRYSLCELEQAPILFDRRSYQTYEITDDLRDLLLNINAVDSVKGIVGDDMYDELVDMEILC